MSEEQWNEIYSKAQGLYDAGYVNGLRTEYDEEDDQATSHPRPGVSMFMYRLREILEVPVANESEGE